MTIELDTIDKHIVAIKNKLWCYKIGKWDSEENRRDNLLLNALIWKRARILKQKGKDKPQQTK